MLFHFHFSLIMMKNMAYYSNNKVFFLLVMFFSSSLLHLGMCDSAASLDQLLPGLAQGDFLQDAKCMQRLLPCQEFLKSPNNPSPACCEPLKEMHENNTQCLCNFVNNTPLFQSLGASKDEILKLPQACGIDVELSKCNNTAAGGGSSQESSSSPASEGEYAASEEESSESTSSTNMITPHGIVYFGVPGFVALLTALVFSSY
ncbi:Lipid transfer-like protein VAS [Glycine soja]